MLIKKCHVPEIAMSGNDTYQIKRPEKRKQLRNKYVGSILKYFYDSSKTQEIISTNGLCIMLPQK